MTQYLACKFRPTDSRTYTYSWDGEAPLAIGDKVTVASPRDEGNMTVEVAAIVPKTIIPDQADHRQGAGRSEAVMKKLGKIASVKFGTGGYQDAMFGLSLSFDFDGTSCSTFEGQWATRSPHARYSEDEWRQGFLDKMLEVKRIMTQAKVDDIGCLRGIPIEAEFDGNALKSWRVLTEVL